ncbi:MAG: hypothetical protein HDR17_15100 [Lachnospiraceae bacterium]|nr:hypothetical protein [Lachnospiraceae bacterium]
MRNTKYTVKLTTQLKMKLSHRKIFGILVLSACILYACTHRHEAYSRGDDLFLNGERYNVISSCLYKESNKKICETDNGGIVYEVEGDKEHNYVVCRYFWEAELFVKESYTPDETTVSGISIGWKKDNYIYDGRIIDCAFSLTDNDELIDDSDEFIDARNKGTMIYVKYGDEVVGRGLGKIYLYKGRYMYYDYSKQKATVLMDDQLELLQEYL